MGYELTLADAWTRPWSFPPRAAMFERNWGAMGRYMRGYLVPAGMVHEVGVGNQPRWPEPEDFGTTEDACEAWMFEGAEPSSGVVEYHEALDKVLAWAPEAPGIPVWKVTLNDPWLITPIELQGALHLWGASGMEPSQEFAEMLAFMGRGIEHGGLRVS